MPVRPICRLGAIRSVDYEAFSFFRVGGVVLIVRTLDGLDSTFRLVAPLSNFVRQASSTQSPIFSTALAAATFTSL